MRPGIVQISDLVQFRSQPRNLDFGFLLEGLMSRLAAYANREASRNTPLTLPYYLHLRLPSALAAGHNKTDAHPV